MNTAIKNARSKLWPTLVTFPLLLCLASQAGGVQSGPPALPPDQAPPVGKPPTGPAVNPGTTDSKVPTVPADLLPIARDGQGSSPVINLAPVSAAAPGTTSPAPSPVPTVQETAAGTNTAINPWATPPEAPALASEAPSKQENKPRKYSDLYIYKDDSGSVVAVYSLDEVPKKFRKSVKKLEN